MFCGTCDESTAEKIEILKKLGCSCKYVYDVTPASRHALTYDDQSWKEKSGEETEDSSSRSSSNDSKQSKTKRVKNFLKTKYKNAIGSKLNNSENSKNDEKTSTWYLEKITSHSEIEEITEVFEENLEEMKINDEYQVANVIIPKEPENDGNPDRTIEFENTSSFLRETQELNEGTEVSKEILDLHEEMKKAKRDVAGLVDRYFSGLYKNYERSKKCLIRQARDLLICEYYGNLERFENEFCIQASKLLQHLKEKSSDGCSPQGWPLCIGPSGVVIHLCPLDPSVVRNKDCYLTLKTRSLPSLEVALIWRNNHELHTHTIAEFRNPLDSLDDIMCSNIKSVSDLEISSYDDYDGTELPELLQNLLVSVEHAIERIPLDDLSFPCPQCLEYLPLERDDDSMNECVCQCSCRTPTTPMVTKKEISIQTSPMFEFPGSIPHIDSDTEDDKESIKSGCLNKRHEVARPKRITELPEKLLLSGIYLPGTVDVDNRPIILCYAQNISKAGLNKYEIAKLLLYYSTIPTSESADKGFTILLIAENEEDFKVLQLLDKSICLIENSMKLSKYLVWRPEINSTEEKTVTNRVQTITVTDEISLEKYILRSQSPKICGGNNNHDQSTWINFFKEAESFLGICKSTGRTLLSTLSKLRSEELPNQITRKFLNHQCRQISKALQMECLQKLQKDGPKILKSLNEKCESLPDSDDVKRKTNFAQNSFNAVDKVAQRLEKLEIERREKLNELAKFRTFQKEISELITWTRKVADETLNNLILLLRLSIDAAGVKEVTIDFEKFFFSAWRQIEKAQDLVEECKNLNEIKGENLKESANNLSIQMKVFKERLEETRVHLENSSRCFLLLESCHDILEDDNKEQEEFIKLASKSGNNKLQEICSDFERRTTSESQPPDKGYQNENPDFISKEITTSSTPIKTQNSQIRRRSISSHAYIYHCSHHAAGEICNCDESDNESSSLSYRLKKKYLLTLQNGCNCPGRDSLERKNSATLGGIKEERESLENILEKIETGHNECKRCDSGVSTGGENSVGDESVVYMKKKLHRTCSCQFCREACLMCSGNSNSSSADSNQDNTESQQDSIMEDNGFVKSNSSDDVEDEAFLEEKRILSPTPANKHLYCHASNLDLPSDALYCNMDTKTQKTLKYIIKEMIETERDYVRSLDYVVVNYIPEISREDIPQALRGQRNIVFGNIEKIFEFHSQHFLTELEECENNPLQVGQIFLKHDKKFYLYALYNKNKPKSDALMSEYGTHFFKSKQIELGDKMDLASYLLKPVQRMGKYALLLQQMMKACPQQIQNASERMMQDFDDLKLAEEMVRFQLRHGNDLLAMDSIRECDVNLKEQGRLLRQNEFLVWEGRSGKKSLRQVFLFEDLILFSKAKRFPDNKNLDLYYYKNSIKMTDIGLTPKVNDSLTKFEIWFRKRKPNDTFTLQSMSQEVKKAWTEELSQLLWKQAIRNRAARLAEMSSMGIGNKPCLDIKPSADQISHRSISIAQLNRSAPRFRNSISGPSTESCRNIKRPNSVISMSSLSSGSTSSGASGSVHHGLTNSISCDSTCESPKPYHRSATLNSQCSMESGIIADISMSSDDQISSGF